VAAARSSALAQAVSSAVRRAGLAIKGVFDKRKLVEILSAQDYLGPSAARRFASWNGTYGD
jgi:hypothetical protein